MRYKVHESRLKFEGMNFKQASLYVSLNEKNRGPSRAQEILPMEEEDRRNSSGDEQQRGEQQRENGRQLLGWARHGTTIETQSDDDGKGS